MNKPQKSKNKIVKYLREVSVVVIGVAITLSASYLITRSNEKRDMRLYLTAIKMELEENIRVFERRSVELQGSVKYSNYLRSNDKDALDADTISHYQNAYHNIPSFSVKTNAFEMFKTSGIMRLQKDKELLLALWDVYLGLTEIKIALDRFLEMKLDEIKEAFGMSDAELEKHIPVYNFYNTNIPYIMWNSCVQMSKELKKVVLLLDKELKIKKIPEKNE